MDVFDTIAGVAFERIAVLRTAGDDTFGTFCVHASPRCVSQVFWHEVTLRPRQLLLFGGAACTGTCVQHRLVHGMATFGGLFTGAYLAADVC